MLPRPLTVTIKNSRCRLCRAHFDDINLLRFVARVSRCASLLLAAFLAGCAPPGPHALLQGQRLIEQGKYSQAVDKLKIATALLGTNAQAWNYLGLACHHLGQTAEAQRAYERALLLDRDLSEAHFNLGCLMLAQPKPESAKAAKLQFMAYVLRRGNSAEGLVKLGLAQLRCGEANEAEKSFTDALRLQPQNPVAWNGLGLVKLQRGRPNEAAQDFTNALQHQPGFRPALLNLAIVSHEYLNKRPFALQEYRKYIAASPDADGIEAVKAVARQLDIEITAATRPIQPSPSERAVTNANVSRSSATNSSQASNSRPADVRGARSENVATAAPPTQVQTNSSLVSAGRDHSSLPPSPPPPVKPSNTVPSIPPVEPELVTLPPEQVFMPAQDVAPPAATHPHAIAEPPPPLPPSAVPSSKPANPGFFQRINPLNLFRHEAKAPTQLTPLPPPKGSPASAGGGAVPVADSQASTEAPAASPTPARYTYKSPVKPESGNRAEAERLLGQGVRAQRERKLGPAIEAYRGATQQDPSYFEAQYNLGLATAQAGDFSAALTAYEYALAIRPDSLDARYNFALVLKQQNYLADAAEELDKVAAYPHESRANLALGNLYAQQLHDPAKARPYYVKSLEADPQSPQADAIRYWLAAHPP
jgi:Flp pilus assembly protein TadD